MTPDFYETTFFVHTVNLACVNIIYARVLKLFYLFRTNQLWCVAMLLRLISGGEESNCILLVSPPSSSSDSILTQFLNASSTESVLISTGTKKILPKDNFFKVVDLKDFLGWNTGIPLKFPDCLLKEVDPIKQIIVIDSLTDLLIFQNPATIASLIRKLKQKASNKAKLFLVLHRDCLDENTSEAIQQLATTIIDTEKLDEAETFPKLCKISHRKLGGKMVISKEVVKMDVSGNIKVEAFKEDKSKSKYIDEDDSDEVIDKLTTFNIGTSKNKEKEAKEKLVLPFYKEEQREGEVKIQGEDPGKIYYEPDSGDDWDDDDPDDDLDF